MNSNQTSIDLALKKYDVITELIEDKITKLEAIKKLDISDNYIYALMTTAGKKYLELEYVDPDTNEKKPFNPFISIDYSQVSDDEKFDGLNALVTSEVEMPDEEIISNYNQLNKIENCFRVTKTDISARPVYVWIDSHIQAHFLTCFISLTMLRYTKYLLNNEHSEEVIINALKSARCEELSNGYVRINASKKLITLHEKLHIDFKMKNIETEKLEKYSKNWCTTFLKTKKEA